MCHSELDSGSSRAFYFWVPDLSLIRSRIQRPGMTVLLLGCRLMAGSIANMGIPATLVLFTAVTVARKCFGTASRKVWTSLDTMPGESFSGSRI